MGTLLLVFTSAIWGLLHSLTASLGAKNAVRKVIGSQGMTWYRLGYNVFSAVSLFPLLALAAMLPDTLLYIIPQPWTLVTLALQLAALVLLVVGVLQTDVWSFIGFSQVMGGKSESKIVTNGLYRYVRHPLYAAGLAFIWLTPQMTLNRLVLYLSLTVYIFIVREGGTTQKTIQPESGRMLSSITGSRSSMVTLSFMMIIMDMDNHLIM